MSDTKTKYFSHPLANGHAPRWASAWGEDRWGPWVEFEIKGVSQRMRWIPEGVSWLGAPRDEDGRLDWELPRRLVELTGGFWLFETPCCQDLWEAVMGNNPSHFKGARRPVEQVNWYDCQKFVEGVNQSIPELNLRLPTEAEWEYACRAGTEAARYGDLDSIAWYDGNSGGETHEVKQKKSNEWGLFDMLGNVYEWVGDAWHQESDETSTSDPFNEGASSSARVIRGGSSFFEARGARAAYRDRVVPSDRFRILGFRCASPGY